MSINFLSFLVNLLFFFCYPSQETLQKAKMVESRGVNPQQRSNLNAGYVICVLEVAVFTFKLPVSLHEWYLSYKLPNENYNKIFKRDNNNI